MFKRGLVQVIKNGMVWLLALLVFGVDLKLMFENAKGLIILCSHTTTVLILLILLSYYYSYCV